jgi:dihydropteroate synthase
LNAPPQERLEGSIAAAVVSILRGASLLRVHDVKAVKRAALVAESIINDGRDKTFGEENKNRYVH